METGEPPPDSTETLLRRVAAGSGELRELLTAVAGDPERLACLHRRSPSASWRAQ